MTMNIGKFLVCLVMICVALLVHGWAEEPQAKIRTVLLDLIQHVNVDCLLGNRYVGKMNTMAMITGCIHTAAGSKLL